MTKLQLQIQFRKNGFTLIELLAVMGIMLILATIAVTSYRSMVSGSGITASLGHLRQTLALARQQAIMQGKSAYVVFRQDATNSWYVTCMAEGTRTGGLDGRKLIDKYRSDSGQIAKGAWIYNLSDDKAKSSVVKVDPPASVFEVETEDSIWNTTEEYYGWEISQRVMLPRGYKFSGTLSTVRFKPDGTAANYAGDAVGGGQKIQIYEEIRTNAIYAVKVNFNGSMEVVYPY